MTLFVLFRFHPHHCGRVQHLHAGGSSESPAEHHRRIPVPGQLCGQEHNGEECQIHWLLWLREAVKSKLRLQLTIIFITDESASYFFTLVFLSTTTDSQKE